MTVLKASALRIDVDSDGDPILRLLDDAYQPIAEVQMHGPSVDMAMARFDAIRCGWVQLHSSYMLH
jgi:hypothetical protein